MDKVLAILAVFRLTELITKDDGPFDIFLRFRNWTGRNGNRSGIHKMVADAVRCPFCIGVYISCIILILPKTVVTILGIAGGQSALESLIGSERE